MRCTWNGCGEDETVKVFLVKTTDPCLTKFINGTIPLAAEGAFRNYCPKHEKAALEHGFSLTVA